MTTSRRGMTIGLLVSATVLGVLAFVAVRSRTHAEAKTDGASNGGKESKGGAGGLGGPRTVPVLVAAVERRDVPVVLEGLGTVTAWKQVLVRSQVDGRLDAVFFTEGQTVRRGQLLAQIDQRPFMVQLHQAEGALARDRAQLTSAKLDAKRYEDLRKTSLIAQQQVDQQVGAVGQLEGTVRVDQAAVESARLNLDYAQIKAPLDGTIGVRLVDPGNIVHASDPTGMLVITQLDPTAVIFTLPEDDLPQISAAQARGGQLVVEAWSRDGGTKLGTGNLMLVDNQINQATATLKLKAMVPNTARQLWPNQFVKARLLVDTRKNALVVAAPAIQRGPQGTFVYVVGADQIATPRNVEVTLTTAELAVLAGGLEPGEQVVIEGQNQLRPGSKVSSRAAAGGGRDAGGGRASSAASPSGGTAGGAGNGAATSASSRSRASLGATPTAAPVVPPIAVLPVAGGAHERSRHRRATR